MVRFVTYIPNPLSPHPKQQIYNPRNTRFGVLDPPTGRIVDLTNAIEGITTLHQALVHDPTFTELIECTTKILELQLRTHASADVHLCSPILKEAKPKVLCVGMNYKEHCEEQGFPIPAEPVIFNKFASSITGPTGNIIFDGAMTQHMDFEVELAVVIGEGGKDIAVEDALDHVAGLTVAHDCSSRDWQFERNGGQWLLGKCQDTFCPLGPALVTLNEIPNLDDLRLTTKLNGTTVQDGNTCEFIFDVPQIIAWISRFITLEPGDIVLTGTPSGVGCFRSPPLWLQHGDIVECEIEHVGVVRNAMVDSSLSKSSSKSGVKSTAAVHRDTTGWAVLEEGYIPMYVGTYTEDKGFVDGQGKGVYPCAVHVETGEMVLRGSPMVTSNPTYVCKSTDGTHLYTLSEDAAPNRGQLSGSSRAWTVETNRNQDSSSGSSGSSGSNLVSSYATGGTDPCYIELNQAETFAFVSNYGTGSVAVFPLRPDRSLGPLCQFVQHETSAQQSLPGPVPDRQDGPHAHQARFHEQGKWLYVPDLGLDCVVQYNFNDETGGLVECGRWTTPAGGGPRHMDWYQERDQYVYVTMEMGNQICVYERDQKTGGLTTLIQTVSSLPVDCDMVYPQNSTAQLKVHPTGQFVYVSNRGHDSIGCYSISVGTGALTAVGWYSTHGQCPRNFTFTSTGAHCIVANQNSHDVYSYKVELNTGELMDTGYSLSVPSPVCVCL